MTTYNFTDKVNSQRKFGAPSKVLQNAVESDRGRIINSAAVRRLQQKTQVFPLERNAAVRSRLTHSMEVQQVGRFIVQQIDYGLSHSPYDLGQDQRSMFRAIESLVEMACLMHDVGNPPFGHFGEKAINDWFANHIKAVMPSELRIADPVLYHQACVDVTHFEGNAQAIRQITSLLNLNLTYSQIASVLKYTRPAYIPNSDIKPEFSFLMKKPGFYLSEKAMVEETLNALNIQQGCRHPLSYIMEAADDISYCFADLEDAVEKHVLSVEQLMTYIPAAYEKLGGDPAAQCLSYFGQTLSVKDMLHDAKIRYDKEAVDKANQFFISLRVKFQHLLVDHAAKRFVDNFEAVYNGHFNEGLLGDENPATKLAKALRLTALNHVFNHTEVEMQELRGHRIIHGLLDIYAPLLTLSGEAFTAIVEEQSTNQPNLSLQRRLFNKLSKKHIRAYRSATQSPPDFISADNPVWERYCRCRLLQDYISGMTDQYAYDEYKFLTVQD
ncbi:dGTPase [Aestuariibacter sp. AA17]|uniref:DGTPase n=1 Tax=Fluctibacter corallii TaxID=2984329 RepID=A0ABT3A8A4_9ALTE|nr:dGTPase [Aestuariibacter sp. AA17]MCV2884833.1 dGTPase [Aestuariibacter sp. AA17]